MLHKNLSGKRFLFITTLGTLVGVLIIAGINVGLDIYGLFRPAAGRKLPVYHAERVSKYLLSKRYVPANFNTIMVGTSLSDNLDFTAYNDAGHTMKIYNASIMGANISEINPIVDNALAGGIRRVIICISPYLTKNSGGKEVEFGDKLYYGALGSKTLYESYVVGLIRHFNLMPSKFPKDQINAYGVNHYNDMFQVSNVKEKIAAVIAGNKDEEIVIDSVALEQFRALIHTLKTQRVQYLGYFHPVPLEILHSKQRDYDRFQQLVRDIIQDDTRLIDFNAPDFQHFTTDYTNYIDHGHLSQQGQSVIVNRLLTHLEQLDQQTLKMGSYK